MKYLTVRRGKRECDKNLMYPGAFDPSPAATTEQGGEVTYRSCSTGPYSQTLAAHSRCDRVQRPVEFVRLVVLVCFYVSGTEAL